MSVELLTVMGDDLMVANTARVSMNKHHDEFDNISDTRLILYLAKHNHWTLKTARVANNANHVNSFIDIAGYAACGAEATLPEEKHRV